MPTQRARQNPLSSTPKKQRLFQCTGYGDCHMVFTRGEHLSRHARKHTGEKPFKCIMPECNKMFSRFDNMMQHTQTHRAATSVAFSAHHRLGSTMCGTTTRTNSCPRRQRQRRSSNSSCSSSGSGSGSSSSSSNYSTCDEQEENAHQHQRRLSVADLCNPPVVVHQQEKIRLTVDEVEALQGFGFLQHTTSDFFDSLHDLITTVGAAANNSNGGGQGGVGVDDPSTTTAASTGNNAPCACL